VAGQRLSFDPSQFDLDPVLSISDIPIPGYQGSQKGERLQGCHPVENVAVEVTTEITALVRAIQREIFQKNYKALEPMLEKTSQELAQAMSRGMGRLSACIFSPPKNRPGHPTK
jgi:hypothetical protein